MDHSSYALVGGDVQAALSSPPGKEAAGGGVTQTDIEMGREDGELPSSVALPTNGPGSSGSRLPNGGGDGAHEDADMSGAVVASGKEAAKPPSRGSVGEKRSRRGDKIVKSAPIQREDTMLAGIRSSLLPGFDALMEDGMDGLEADAVADDTEEDMNSLKGNWGWETFGIQRYRAVLRRESGAGGKRLDLEAQVRSRERSQLSSYVA